MHLFYVSVKNIQPSYYDGPALGHFGALPTQIPVVASCFTEAIDKVERAYGRRVSVTGVALADVQDNLEPLL